MRDHGGLDAIWTGLDPALFEGGAGEHPWMRRLASDPGRGAGPDLADAIHWLALLHGGAAGLVDGASLLARSDRERRFLNGAFDAWQSERAALASLAVAVGPVPSTSGHHLDEVTTADLAHAIATLATSERDGVSLGAATALIVEWHGLRALMERAAERFGCDIRPCVLPSQADLLATVAGFIDAPGVERAMAFGADQLVRQHGTFVAMLQRRSAARAQG